MLTSEYEQILQALLGVPAILTVEGRRTAAAVALVKREADEIEKQAQREARTIDELGRDRALLTGIARQSLIATAWLLSEGAFDDAMADPQTRSRSQDVTALTTRVCEEARGTDRGLGVVLARGAVNVVFEAQERLGAVQIPEHLRSPVA